jgi:hypothetical protein
VTNPAITARAAALALGAFLLLHQPARAGMVSVLEADTSGESIWVYTGGTIERTYNFSPIQGTDALGGSQGSVPIEAVPSGDVPGGGPGPDGSTSSVPEPGTLALLGFPLLFVAAVVRRRR